MNFDDEPWKREGACRPGMNTAGLTLDHWFPTDGPGEIQKQMLAIEVCLTECNVTQQCLEHAVKHVENHGVWGGASERDRARIRREFLRTGEIRRGKKARAFKGHGNSRVTAFGETMSLAVWSRDDRCIVHQHTLRTRIFELGWEPEKALTTPARDAPKFIEASVCPHCSSDSNTLRFTPNQDYCRTCGKIYTREPAA